jgi:hypothetical protein
MIYNSNASKKSQLIKPEKLFSLPQDKLYKRAKNVEAPTVEQTRLFAQQVENLKNKKVFKI